MIDSVLSGLSFSVNGGSYQLKNPFTAWAVEARW